VNIKAAVQALGAILLVGACAGSGGPVASVSKLPVQPASFGPPIQVTGNAKTGSSPALALEGGYQLRWTITPDKPGCAFRLGVAASAGGPTVVDLGQSVLPGKAPASGSASFSIASGRYFIQADRTDPLACKSGWTASLQAQVAGAPSKAP